MNLSFEFSKMFFRFNKMFLQILISLQLASFGCDGIKEKLNKKEKLTDMIDKNKAIEISKKDASLVYGDLSVYEITAKLKSNIWIIDYVLKDKNSVGGGPHYVISATNGEILEFKYYQ